MELNFDKEMDALLRQAAQSGEVVSTNPQNHLDADEISAFAENALPEKTRSVYIKHFADCDRCRTILSNTILLNAEAEIETASSAVSETAPEVIETKIPWYRKLFLMPNLAYTMGALVLVFGGMLGFLILQNANKGLSDVAQSSANKSAERGPNAAEDQSIYESSESNNASANMANSTANTSIVATNSMTEGNANTSVSTANSTSSLPLTEQTKTGTEDESRDSKNETGRKENDFLTDGASGAENRALAKSDEEKADDKQRAARQDAATDSIVTAAPPPKSVPQASPPQPSKDVDAESEKLTGRSKKAAKREDFTKRISGKTFNRVNGVWIDSAYNRYDGVSSNAALPPTRTIRRGSDEYRKLDKQVRIIAESFDGPVIIVWKDGAYRIQ
ncbi:hypothetical protein BH20ACI4_BH20ACI4_22710 [soil metagenome]